MSQDLHKANALLGETSPYLLQHAHNPVDWLPWGETAFEKAKLEDKPILLSVGYSACHWCHVMERESFENLEIATLMNTCFVPVKVDREERPDVDSVYMSAVQVMTGAGGWPMTVFLTPDGQPFYGGTYFPPDDRYGRPGFRRVLEGLHQAWVGKREELQGSANDLTKHLLGMEQLRGTGKTIETSVLKGAFSKLEQLFDPRCGGFGQAPKFPNPGGLEWLLQHHARTQDPKALEMLEQTLTGMAVGGLYDQLGGGFARYSTDERWLVPHFEKMLYDNAQLVRVYLHAFQVTGKGFYARIARETLEFVLRELTGPDGEFYSALDADSEGVEGKFYVWDQAEIQAALGDDAVLFSQAFGVTPAGNWEGHNILVLAKDAQALAEDFDLSSDEITTRLNANRQTLLGLREQRVRPGLDDKMLTSWNGLMLGAFAEAARVLNEPRYLEVAKRNVALVRNHLLTSGRLLHTYKAGQAKITGLLEDYALYATGLLELYRSNFDREMLALALELTGSALSFFLDENGGFFDTPSDGERLIVRPKSFFDSAMPSGNGAMACLLVQLARLAFQPEWEGLALEICARMTDFLTQQPTGFGSLLQACEAHLAPHVEVAVVGALEEAQTKSLLAVIQSRYLPFMALAAAEAGEAYLPLLEDRDLLAGSSAAYVCQNLACQLPTSDPLVLEKLLLVSQQALT